MEIQNKVIISGTVLVLLVGATFLSSLLETESNKQASGAFFQDVDIASFDIITVGDSADGIELHKVDGFWRVQERGLTNSYLADQVRVGTLLDKIVTMHKDQLVSENASNRDELGVTEEKGISVSLSGTDESISFIIGNKNANWRQSNVRLSDDNAVYLVSGSIRFAFKTELENWRDRALFSHQIDSIKSVNVMDIVMLNRVQGFGGNEWYANNGGIEIRANDAIVNQYLRSVTTLTTTDWADNSITEEQWSPSSSAFVIITMKDGTEEKLSIGTQDVAGRNLYYFKNSGREDLYLVTPTAAEIPFITFEYLTYNPEAVQNISVNSDSSEVEETVEGE